MSSSFDGLVVARDNAKPAATELLGLSHMWCGTRVTAAAYAAEYSSLAGRPGVDTAAHAWRPVDPQMQLFGAFETPKQTPCERSEGG